jgi:hypothetical protein
MMTLGELIAARRKERGWSLRKLEVLSKVSNALISQIETGHVKDPGFTRGKTMFLDKDIHRIRALKGVVPARELAQEYGVRPNMIYKIQLRLNWKHVPELNPSVSIGERT